MRLANQTAANELMFAQMKNNLQQLKEKLVALSAMKANTYFNRLAFWISSFLAQKQQKLQANSVLKKEYSCTPPQSSNTKSIMRSTNTRTRMSPSS
jgi:hypothetical protein